jgi:hypothetical protein
MYLGAIFLYYYSVNISLNALYIDRLLGYYFYKCLSSPLAIYIFNAVHPYYAYALYLFNFYTYGILFLGLVTFITFLFEHLGFYTVIILLLDWHLFNIYNWSLLYFLKKYKDKLSACIHIFFISYNIISIYILNSTEYEVKIYSVILLLCLLSLIYINYVNKEFKYKYPYLSFLINVILICLSVVITYWVLISPRGPMRPPQSTGGGRPGSGGFNGPGGPNGPRDPNTTVVYHKNDENRPRHSHNLEDEVPYPDRLMRDVHEDEKLKPWYYWDGTNRPRTPEPLVSPESPRSSATREANPLPLFGERFNRTGLYSTPTPRDGMYARHNENSILYFDRPIVNGDRYRWHDTDQVWVPGPQGLWVNRDWVYLDDRWYWMVGRTHYWGARTNLMFRPWYGTTPGT